METEMERRMCRVESYGAVRCSKGKLVVETKLACNVS